MYWYLSFLRPPPVSVNLSSGSISITPQVTNDLRTDTRFEPTDIHHVWQRTHPSSGDSLAAEHLATYIPPSSTYQAITVPLPPQAKAGDKWRLGLFSPSDSQSEQTAGPSSITLWRFKEDNAPLVGVWSEPIEILADSPRSTSRSKEVGSVAQPAPVGDQRPTKRQKAGQKQDRDVPKQTRIQREWGLGGGVLLRVIEQTSFDLDKKVWDSGLALASWIWRKSTLPRMQVANRGLSPEEARTEAAAIGRNEHHLTNEVMQKLRFGKYGQRIVELGSGTGLVSIALRSALLNFSPDTQGNIFATDLDSALELMRENIALAQNASARWPGDNLKLSARKLDWDEALPDWVTERWLDVIIAADVTYNTAVFPAFVRTVIALMKDTNEWGQHPPLLLAYKQRDPGERALWDMLKKEGLEMVMVDKVQGAEPEGEVEIWVGKLPDEDY